MRPRRNGPRSFTRRFTERPLSKLVTLIVEPSGSVGWAAVSLRWSNTSPLEVNLPRNLGPYQEASPICKDLWGFRSFCGCRRASGGVETRGEAIASFCCCDTAHIWAMTKLTRSTKKRSNERMVDLTCGPFHKDTI